MGGKPGKGSEWAWESAGEKNAASNERTKRSQRGVTVFGGGFLKPVVPNDGQKYRLRGVDGLKAKELPPRKRGKSLSRLRLRKAGVGRCTSTSEFL